MSEPSLALQGALYAALKDQTPAGSSIFDSFDRSPDIFPRIVIGSAQTVPSRNDCWRSYEVFAQVDVFSDAAGFPEVKRIAGQILSLLDGQENLTVADYALSSIDVASTTFTREAGGAVSRARIEVEAVLEHAP